MNSKDRFNFSTDKNGMLTQDSIDKLLDSVKKPLKVVMTGITGFVGSHLAEYILSLNQDIKVYGLTRWRSPKDNLSNIYNKVILFNADLRDLGSMVRQFDEIRPDIIMHLAAASYVQSSFNSPIDTLATNVIGTANLLEAVRILREENNSFNPIIGVASSSEVYGQVDPEDTPTKETCQLRPASPYAVSKVGEDMIALQYWLSYRIRTIRSRAFNHEGPRRGEVFFSSSFAKQLAAIKLGLMPGEIHVGNLNSIRTICDVRDMVRAYWLMVNKCDPGEVYNIGGNVTETVGDVLKELIRLSGVNPKPKVIIDPNRLRPSDVTLQIPCVDKFKGKTGWEPEISLEQTLKDTLDYWGKELTINPWKITEVE